MSLRVNRTALVVLIILGIALVVSAVAVASWVMNREARAKQFLEEARAMAAEGQDDRAIIQYMNVIKNDPENVAAYIELADLHVKNGDLNNAYRYYQTASQKDPKNVDVLSKLTECYHIATQWDDVRRTAARIVSLAPGGAAQARAHHYLGQAYYVDAEYEKAAEQFRMAAEYDPSNLDAILALALIQAQYLDRMDAAELTVRTLLEVSEDGSREAARRAEAAVRAAKFYAALKRSPDALKYYRKALELQGDDPQYWLALGDFYKRGGRDAESLSNVENAYKKALEVRPGDPDAILSLGLFHKEAGRNDRVIEMFEKGIAAPDARAYHQLFYQHLIEALLAQSDVDGAWSRLVDLREMKNVDDIADYLEGRICLSQADGVDENLLKAERLFSRVTTVKPRFPHAYYYLGLCLAARGMLDDAKVEFQRAQALVAEFPEATVALAETYMRTREFTKAILQARSILERHRDNFRANLIVGRALLAQKNLTGALNFLEQARSIQPASPEPYIALADLYSERGDWEEAVRVLDQARRTIDEPDRARTALALIQQRRGKQGEAAGIAYELAFEKPTDHKAASFYVSMLWRQGRAEDALDFLGSRLQTFPDDPAYHNLMGNLKRSLGRNEEALESYARSLELSGADRDALAGAAETLVNLGRHEQAREKIRLLDQADPGSPAVDLLEARIFEEEGKLDAAAALLRNSLRQNSANAQAHYRLSILQKKRGEPEKAIESLESALRYSPSSVAARLALAELYYETRYFEDALREATLATKYSGDDPQALSRAIRIKTGSLVENQRIDDAISEWVKLPTEIQDDGHYALRLGYLHLMNGQLDDAEESFRKAASLMPPAAALEGLARIHMARDEYDRALAQVKAGLDADPRKVTRLRLLQIEAAIYLAQDRREEALAAVSRTLEAAGADPLLLVQAGDAFLVLGELERAVEAYRKATVSPGAGDMATRRLIAALQESGRFDEAGAMADELLKKDSNDFKALVLKSKILLGTSKPGKATALLERALASSNVPDRESAAARFLLGQAYYGSGLLPAAETQLRRALAQEPHFNQARLLLAEVLLRNGSFEQAATAARTVVASEPGNAKAWAIKADAAKLSGNVEDSIVDYRKALELERNTATLLALMDALGRLARESEADKVLEDYVSQDPTDAATVWMLAKVYDSRGRLGDAEAVLETALEADSSAVALRSLLADVYRKQGKLPEAEALLKKSVEENPSPEAYRTLAALYAIEGRNDKAQATFTEGIEAYPGYLNNYTDLADLVSTKEDFARGVAVLRGGIEANPNDEGFYAALASFYIRLERGRDAESFMERTLEEKPLFSGLACTLGDWHLVSGRPDEALEAYEHALKFAPGEVRPRAANAVAWVLAEKGTDLRRAVELASEASLLRPDNPDILDTLGWAFFKNKQYYRAVVNLARAVELSNEPAAETLYHLALAYREAGMLANAQGAARRALAADASLAGDEDIEALMALE